MLSGILSGFFHRLLLTVLLTCSVFPALADPGASPRPREPGDRLFHTVATVSTAPLRAVAGAPTGFTRLLFPVAVAAKGDDVYIVDSGQGKVFRYEMGSNTFFEIPGAPARIDTRIAVGHDHSLYVLDPGSRRILHFLRDGRLLRTLDDISGIGLPTGFVLDERQGIFLVADAVFSRLMALPLSGGPARLIHLQEPPQAGGRITGIAAGPDGYYLIDSSRGWIAVYSSFGQLLYTLGDGELRESSSLAVDAYGRVFLATTGEASLEVLAREGFRAKLSIIGAMPLGMSKTVAIDNDFLFLAEGELGRVRILRILPPSPR